LILRLPLTKDKTADALTLWSVDAKKINDSVILAGKKYLEQKFPILQHGKKLELINQSIVPLRAMAVYSIVNPTYILRIKDMQIAIKNKLYQSKELGEFFEILQIFVTSTKKSTIENAFYQKFCSIFNATDSIAVEQLINDIDECIDNFDQLQKNISIKSFKSNKI
jgi:hypothetical protein